MLEKQMIKDSVQKLSIKIRKGDMLKEVRNLGIPVHKACGTENHCTGEGDRFGGKSAGVYPVQRFM